MGISLRLIAAHYTRVGEAWLLSGARFGVGVGSGISIHDRRADQRKIVREFLHVKILLLLGQAPTTIPRRRFKFQTFSATDTPESCF